MRFYEFAVSEKPFINYNLVILERYYNETKHIKLDENSEFEQLAKEFRDFINVQQTNPKDLTVGGEYYPMVITARPSAHKIDIELSDLPVKYLGVKDKSFVFNGPNVQFEVYVNSELIDDFGQIFISTTVFAIESLRDQLLTLMATKFLGNWKIERKELRV